MTLKQEAKLLIVDVLNIGSRFKAILRIKKVTVKFKALETQ